MPTDILGVSAFYHDSAACLVREGQIVAAAQEERFTRKKFDARFPTRDPVLPARGEFQQTEIFCLLRQAADQVRASIRNLCGFFSKGHQILSRRDAGLAQGEAATEERVKG
jgi:predicted NodU family carbamoyl transferase